jgi:hypothetical protein
MAEQQEPDSIFEPVLKSAFFLAQTQTPGGVLTTGQPF